MKQNKAWLLYIMCILVSTGLYAQAHENTHGNIKSTDAIKRDSSQPLNILAPPSGEAEEEEENEQAAFKASYKPYYGKSVQDGATIEQTGFGKKPSPTILTSFDGIGAGFNGPQGTTSFLRNPSDNALAVGIDYIVQIVNTRMAVYTKKGKRFDTTGRILYGPVETRNVFRGFGGPCEKLNNGDAVVRYDQLANRWLIVMPTFRRLPSRKEAGFLTQPGKAEPLFQPPAPTGPELPVTGRPGPAGLASVDGTYCMCYAVSTSPDPLGSYYRYEFDRPLFPDYPRPAIWPDGYYTTSSTGDNLIQRQVFIADRIRMLKGADAREQSFLVDGVNFLLNADIDGKKEPPKGSPNIMMAAGGTQLKKVLDDDGIYVWKVHVDWKDSSKTSLEGPVKIQVAPYHYMGDGQLTKAVPQPGTDQRLDAQGDKLMSRLVYRRIGKRESLVAVHSVSTLSGGGGVRWYEFRVDKKHTVSLYQQGTYAPGGDFRWLAGAAEDGKGDIGIGYSFGGASHFPGQRFAGRLFGDSLGVLTLNEAVLAEGEAAQTTTLRWEDYTYTVIDPSDDMTFWYVGDYLKLGATNYSTRIGSFRLPQ
jgi:hypothetical protein